MKTIKLNLPDAIADRIDAKGKELGFESLGDYIEFDLTQKEVSEKEFELEEAHEKEVIVLEERIFESRREKRLNNLKEDMGLFCNVLKENFPNMKLDSDVSVTEAISPGKEE